MQIVEPSVKLLHSTANPEQVIEYAGRVCYASSANITATSSTKFIEMLLDSKHESVLEHASASFHIVCDRAIANEIERHRLAHMNEASFSQQSTRYCNFSKDKFNNEIKVIKPSRINDDTSKMVWKYSCQLAEENYFKLLELNKPEDARSVLPLCLATELVMTTNLRDWLHFLKLRTAKSAHPDMVIIANLIAAELVAIAPNVFKGYAK